MTRLFTAVAASLAAISMATGCAQRGTQAQQIRNISVDTSADGWETVAKRARIKKTIHLSDSVLLGNISKLLCHNGNIYLLDKSSRSILCYNGEGELQFRICTVGRGPGEYTGISNFYLSGRKNRLYIIAPEKKLLEYSAITGELLSSRPIDAKTIMFTDGAQLEGGETALGIVGPQHNLAICAADTIKYHIPFNMARDFSFMEKAFAQQGSQVLFIHGMSNNIYSVEPDSAYVKYVVDFKGYEIPDKDYLEKSPAEIQEIHNSRTVATRVDNLTDSPQYLSFSYWLMHPNKEQETRYVLFNKRTGESVNIHNGNLFPIRDVCGELFVSLMENTGETAQDNGENPVVVMWKL